MLLAHEAWHRVQDQLGFSAQNVPNAHLASERARALRLEMRALATALRSRGVGQRRAMEDALVLRAARQAAFLRPRRRSHARPQRGPGSLYRRAPGRRRARQRLRPAHPRCVRPPRSFVRAYAGATGPAYGLLLDQHCLAGARRSAQRPADLLIGAPVRRRPPARGRGRLGLLWRPQIAAEERARAEAEAERLAALLTAYAGPRLKSPSPAPGLSSTQPDHPDRGACLHYQTLTLRDAWGELRRGGRRAQRRFPHSPRPRARGDGLSGPGWRLESPAGRSPGRRAGRAPDHPPRPALPAPHEIASSRLLS